MKLLLDTTAASQVGRSGAPEPVRAWLARQRDEDLAVSVLALGEIRKGIELMRGRDPDAAERLDQRVALLARALGGRVISVTAEIAERWGEMQAARGPLPPVDSLIAATAQVHGLTVVTRNVADFERCGVAVIDPWSPEHEVEGPSSGDE